MNLTTHRLVNKWVSLTASLPSSFVTSQPSSWNRLFSAAQERPPGQSAAMGR